MARAGELTCSDAAGPLGVAAAPPAAPGIPRPGDPPQHEDDAAVDEVPECLHMIQVAIGMSAEGGRANESNRTGEGATNSTPPGEPRAPTLADLAGYRLKAIMRRAWGAASSASESRGGFSIFLLLLLVATILFAVVLLVIRSSRASEAQLGEEEFTRPPRSSRSSHHSAKEATVSFVPSPSYHGVGESSVRRPGTGVGESSVMSSVSHSGTPQLPIIYPALVMPMNATRLAVPVDPLTEPSFSVDVLSPTGMAILTVSFNERVSSNINICLHGIGTLIAVVDPSQQISTADGTVVGTLGRASDPKTYTLRDTWGRELLSVAVIDGTPELSMYTQYRGRKTECAKVHRRGPGYGRLPKEHYELVVNPGVDSVLVTACLLGLVNAWINADS